MDINEITKKLNARQKAIYDFIVDYTKKNLYSPSYQEICEATGLKSKSSIYVYIKDLKAYGLIETDESPRCIKLLGYKLIKL